jgi:hypothetical protein
MVIQFVRENWPALLLMVGLLLAIFGWLVEQAIRAARERHERRLRALRKFLACQNFSLRRKL